MSTRPPARTWGPSHQTDGPVRPHRPLWARIAISVLSSMFVVGFPVHIGAAVYFVAAGAVIFLQHRPQRPRPRTADTQADGDPLATVHAKNAQLGGGVYLGQTEDKQWRLARRERAVLVLGPPRSGKSSGVIIPAVLSHNGPVVTTSTKPDVAQATHPARARMGTTWIFDPTGTAAPRVGQRVRWSPVTAARTWDGALLMARAMVTGAAVGTGTTNETHWAKRAQALLAPLLHAAATHDLDVNSVLEWTLRHDLEQPALLLHQAGAGLAGDVLTGLQNTEPRERSSILSAAADALDAYTTHAALLAAREPNFDADQFVRSRDTLSIHAPAEHQHLAAPLVCGLLAEIRRATYRAHTTHILPRPVLFALDEVANIAPLAELPQIASEGGGQGLTLLAAVQDLSQARARWGPRADGFLTLFGTKLILPGIADPQTLEAISVTLGEYDRRIVSTTRGSGPATGRSAALFGPPDGTTLVERILNPHRSTTITTQRTRVLSPGEIAGIPAGRALHLDGTAWELLRLTPAHTTEPWRTLTQHAPSCTR